MMGVGTVAPTEGLDVQTGMRVGASGRSFLEIYEKTGTTHASWSVTQFSLPDGYEGDNTHILSMRIIDSNGLAHFYGEVDPAVAGPTGLTGVRGGRQYEGGG